MKTLFLFRHAKAEAPQPGQDDFDRALTERGRAAAAEIARALESDARLPQLILASPAARTRQSAEIFAKSLAGAQPRIEFHASLYSATAVDYLTLLAGLSEEMVMIAGHNPAIEDAVELLGKKALVMKPGSCMVFDFDVESWTHLVGGAHARAAFAYVP